MPNTPTPRLKFDQTDLAILRILQESGRITNVQLSQAIGLSPAPTLERVRKLEQMGIIASYHALIDAERLGLKVTVFVEISLDLHRDTNIESVMQTLASLDEVQECYHITGGADFLLKVLVPDLPTYQRLIVDKLAKLPGVGRLQTQVVLGTVKRNLSVNVETIPNLRGD